jgi:transposase-like protein
MALDQSALSELLDALRAGGDLDVVREALALVLQALIEAEAAEVIGAGRYERTASRTTHRNGSRTRLLSTKAGDVELRLPKLREGSFFPALLEPRRRIDRALLAVVMEAYVHGTSTRKSTTWSKRWAWTPGSPGVRSAGSVPSSTPRSLPSGPGRWRTPPSRTCSWTPPTSKLGWTAGWSAARW